MKNNKNGIGKKFVVRLAILGAAMAFLMFVPPFSGWMKTALGVLGKVDVASAKEYILSFGPLAPVVSFLLMMLQSVAAPLPAFILTFSNAALFGWLAGAALSWSSAMAGAALCFFIAKFLGRDVVEKIVSKAGLKAVDRFFEKHGNYAILVARLLPFMSFDIVSYGAGLTSMRFWPFFIATGLGQLPATLIYSYVGDKLVGGSKLVVTGLLVMFAIGALMVMIKHIAGEKRTEDAE